MTAPLSFESRTSPSSSSRPFKRRRDASLESRTTAVAGTVLKSSRDLNVKIIELAKKRNFRELNQCVESNFEHLNFINAMTICHHARDRQFFTEPLFQERAIPVILDGLSRHGIKEFRSFLLFLEQYRLLEESWWKKIAEIIWERKKEFNLGNLCHFAKLYASNNFRNSTLFEAISSEVGRRPKELLSLSMKELAILSDAYAKSGIQNRNLFRDISHQIKDCLFRQGRIVKWQAKDIALFLRACANNDFFEEEFFAEAAEIIQKNLPAFILVDLALIAESYAMFWTLARTRFDCKYFCIKLEKEILRNFANGLTLEEKWQISTLLSRVNASLDISDEEIPKNRRPLLPTERPGELSDWEKEVGGEIQSFFPNERIPGKGQVTAGTLCYGYYPSLEIQNLKSIVFEVEKPDDFYLGTRAPRAPIKFRNEIYCQAGVEVIPISDRWESMGRKEKQRFLKTQICWILDGRRNRNDAEEWFFKKFSPSGIQKK